jgi:exopolyphosphatase / guanosine-5'-triphosphate,3'-diphosphate pyrophosphatase
MTLQRQSGTTDRSNISPAPAKRERAAQGRLGTVRPVAVIDIGSNSVRQVIYEGMTRAPAVLFNEKVLCGLGRGVQATGELDPAAIDRALAALRRFRALGRQADVTETHIVATAAARDASNGRDFLDSVEQLFGRDVTLLTGTLEAQYSAWGVRSGFYRPDGIVGDLGGGSLELVPINGEIGGGLTLPLGGLRLAEASGVSIEAAKLLVERELAGAKVAWPGAQRNFYAVGGTWRSLAKLHIAHSGYPLPVLHDYTVAAKAFIAFCKRVATKPLDNYKGIDAVSRNRRALLPYGALVMAGVLRSLKAEKVVISSLGVREGYLYSMLGDAERNKDSLLAAAYDLAILRARSPRHSVELAEWTGKAFATLGIDETEDEARWRIAACYLADIAWRAHPDYRAQQSLSIIANAGFVGISHEGRAYLALANYHRYLGVGTKIEPPGIVSLAGERCRRRARLLAALFRVLYLYSASQPGVIRRLRLEAVEPRFVLTVPDSLAELCGERPAERVAQLAKELGSEIELKCGR